jgi:hypothetical protein
MLNGVHLIVSNSLNRLKIILLGLIFSPNLIATVKNFQESMPFQLKTGINTMLTMKLRSIYIKNTLAKSNVKIDLLLVQRRINRVSGIFMRA